MRTKPLVGRTAWFGPKRGPGWGWRPISPEGWVATLLTLGVGLAATVVSGSSVPTIVAAALLLVLSVVKGSTPGGVSPRVIRDRITGRPPRA